MWYLNDEPVGNVIVLDDRRIINPTKEQYLEAGCVWRDAANSAEEEASAEASAHVQEFAAACNQFKQVCAQIRQALGVEKFTGGFDEMVEFQQSPIYSTIPGLQLAMAWSAANELCKYTGAKLGYGQPEWWYQCWAEPPQEPVDDVVVVEEPEPEPEEFDPPEAFDPPKSEETVENN